jgi:hypothetical protein
MAIGFIKNAFIYLYWALLTIIHLYWAVFGKTVTLQMLGVGDWGGKRVGRRGGDGRARMGTDAARTCMAASPMN